MKQYQARNLNGDVECVFETESEARAFFRTLNVSRCGLFLAEWESEAEADKARIDHMQEHGVFWTRTHHGTLRDAVDRARNAPKPTITKVEI